MVSLFIMAGSMKTISQHHHFITYYLCSDIADSILFIACVTKPQVHQHSIDCGILPEKNMLPNDTVREEWQQRESSIKAINYFVKA